MTRTVAMHDPFHRGFARVLVRWLAPVLVFACAVPAFADTQVPESTDARLRRLESELRAVQRKVFPDGAGKTFAPEITPGDAAGPPPVAPSGSPALADVLTRMDAVEAQIKALTASSEENQDRLGKLESRISAVETAQTEAPPTPQATQPPPPVAAAPVAEVAPARPAKKPTAASAPVAADHAAAIAAIERPSTDDKAEDAYTYGYRLWEAKFFPEAEAVLIDFAQTYPHHKRISFARNLLGRAYLDDNKPGAAAQWFLQNYQADKAGERAADSLLYLGVAMTRLKETKRACVVFDEFRQTYPGDASGRLKGQFDAVTKTVTCH